MTQEYITLEEYFNNASDAEIIDYIASLDDIQPALLPLIASGRHSLIVKIYDTPEYNNSRSHWVNLAIEARNYILFAELMKTPIRDSYKIYRKYFLHIFGSALSIVYIGILKRMRPEVLESPYFFYLATRHANKLEYYYILEQEPSLYHYVDQVAHLINSNGSKKTYDFVEAYDNNSRL